MRYRFNETRHGITIVELLVVLVVIAILFVILAPAILTRHAYPKSIQCMNNQKQVAIANILWMTDNSDRFPWQVPIAEGGSLEHTNQALPHFQALSNYMLNPLTFACPSDSARTPTNTYAQLSQTNLSYFLNLDAGTNFTPRTFLSGDRHLALSNQPVRPGSFLLRGDQFVSWTSELHNGMRYRSGRVSFADGHVEAIRAVNLQGVVARQPLGTNRLVVP
jgi:prepilin-type processing-associated H-X9-DG protein